MEIGNLAEWVTGLAELAAVLTTLFFSFYQNYFDRKHKRGLAARSLRTLATSAMDSLAVAEEAGVPLTYEAKSADRSYHLFNEWLRIKTIVADPASEPIIDAANEVKGILDNCTSMDRATRQRVDKILGSLPR
ncbi:hypothetical protein [Bifidobacterium favimelis]